ncbi:MAG: tetratricopeptide repeat protein [Thermoplasmata archaeon]|nr:MAG: tetratricopeptide repeat protein [Thermoplasmata archaeon]
MPSCPECNNEISEGSQICIHCGAKFDAVPADAPKDREDESSGSGKKKRGKGNPGGNNAGTAAAKKNLQMPKSKLKLDMKSTFEADINGDAAVDEMNTEAEDLDTGAPGDDPPSDESMDDSGTYEPAAKKFSPQHRAKWLAEQEKIKMELEALKGKVSKQFRADSSLDMNEDEEDIFMLDEMDIQHIRDTTLGLEGRTRPLTPEEEQKKSELLSELNDLKEEGYEVGRLERIVNVDPTSAWNEFVKFMDDIEVLQKLRKRYSDLDTTGFEFESQSIRSKLDNPDMINQIEKEINELERKIAGAEGQPAGGGLDELITAGKEAFRKMEYQKALNFYDSAMKIDPNNREVEFYKRKTEAKLQAMSSMKGAAAPTPVPSVSADAGISPTPQLRTPVTLGGQPVQRKVRKVSASSPKVARRPVSAKPMAKKPVGRPVPAAPKRTIPTGGTADVKTPLSVSMTPKLPAKKKVVAKPQPQVGAPAPQPAAAPSPPASGNPAEIEALGFNAFINKDYQKALDYYNQVLALDPNFPGAAAQRDKCLEFLGK